ncbi:hypothetical protein F4801DRAFT_584827 [Xylaria longipes]|nr:hypothetical protein F4801DRAFT_584827 [Xylaria longipes]
MFLVSTEVVVAAAATELLRQSHCCGTAAAVPPQPQSSASLRMLDHLMAILKCFDVDAEVNYDKLVEKLNLSRRSAHGGRRCNQLQPKSARLSIKAIV